MTKFDLKKHDARRELAEATQAAESVLLGVAVLAEVIREGLIDERLNGYQTSNLLTLLHQASEDCGIRLSEARDRVEAVAQGEESE